MSERTMKAKLITGVTLAVLSALAGYADAGTGRTVKASSFGFDPSDSTVFLQRAIDSGASRIVVDRQAGDWIVRPIMITNSNVEVVLEDGVTIRAKRGEFYGLNDCLIDINRGAHDVILRGEGQATLQMNKADYLDPDQKYPFAEWRMGVNICRARNVQIRNLTILSSGGDGVYVGAGSTDVLLEDLVCKDHNRQGISVTGARRLTVRRCRFDDTYGAAPQCGIDIEPNRPDEFAEELLFEDCTFDGNAAHGFDMYLGCFVARTAPVSVTFRRCVARGNRDCGISLMTGSPKNVIEQGPVRGTVRFESCTISNNAGEALKVINHTPDGLDISFCGCTFDARGTKAASAMLFSNAHLQRDFGSLTFKDCRVVLDATTPVCDFEAPEGIGIGGSLKGILTVERDGRLSTVDLAEFAKGHPPRPELVSDFKSMLVDYKTLVAPPDTELTGVYSPAIRKSFVFVQAVPAAGEYAISFRSRKLRKDLDRKPCGVVQLLDRAGTDLGKFTVPEGDFTYRLKAPAANVYRFEIAQGNGSCISVATKTPGGAILFDSALNLFCGRNVNFSFLVPASAREVKVNLQPEEPASAELLDASGAVVAVMPFQSRIKTFCVKRTPSASDEVWTLRLPHIAEDLNLQVGGDAVPLLSVEKAGVIRRNPPCKVRLSELDVSGQESGWGTPQVGRSVCGKPLEIGGIRFSDGVGTHAFSRMDFDVFGKAVGFSAKVGIDTGTPGGWRGTSRFVVLADDVVVAQSPVLKCGMPACLLKAELAGARRVSLIATAGGDGHANDIADWCEAVFEMTDGTRPVPLVAAPEPDQLGILTPPAGPEPRINPPYVFGVRTGHPILFRLPVSGARPMSLSVSGLPEGASFDAVTGRLGGCVSRDGSYELLFTASNACGVCHHPFRLVVGDRISLTPPMGWNSWNCFGPAVSEKAVREAAEKMVSSGLADYGWSYVNIDDFWQHYLKDDGKNQDICGPARRTDGAIAVNARFGCLRKLTDDLHGLGLKAGIYSSPGPLTCGGCTGSWGHEEFDAATFARWGFDYLKYDWCSYGEVLRGEGLESQMAPYFMMGRALKSQSRDIVFSLCQYGMSGVSAWGRQVDGQCWRTTQDIRDTWTSVRIIVEAQKPLWAFAGPGAWNDPDMLVVGKVGGWTGRPHATHLTPNEQYSHISWWCLLSAPLMIGCDLGELDAFTRALLTNPEMLEVNQDPLGAAAACVAGGLEKPDEVWIKPMEDGSSVVGLFNVSSGKRTVVLDLERLGYVGTWRVRDLWRCRDEGEFSRRYAVTLPAHAPHVIRLWPGKDGRLRAGIGDVRDLSWRQLFVKTEAGMSVGCEACGCE